MHKFFKVSPKKGVQNFCIKREGLVQQDSVHYGINPLQKHPSPLFFLKLPPPLALLNLETVHVPFLGYCPNNWFSGNLPENKILQWIPHNIKIFHS